MKTSELEARMRALERFHGLRVSEGEWPIVRVDGRSFSRLTEERFEKPFDVRFHALMVKTAEALLRETRALYAYTESDEISLLCPKAWDFFDRELEKIISVTASIAAAAFSLALGAPVVFDSRLIAAPDERTVIDYFRWRQADAQRCALNGWCYWTLRKQGQSVETATGALDNRDVAHKTALLSAAGIDFASQPAWQREGTGLYWRSVEKEGYNPKLQAKVLTTRERIHVDEALPSGIAYDNLLRGWLA
jgi:tRNA(His) guanylyltransferase